MVLGWPTYETDLATWLKLARKNSILYFVGKLDHGIHFLLRLFAFLHQLLELFVHSVLSAQEGVDQMLLDRETGLHRFLTSPVFSMSLSFNKYLESTVPTLLI